VLLRHRISFEGCTSLRRCYLRIREATVKTKCVDDRTAAVTAAMERGVLRLTK
jgi:hypothetical protein